MKSESFECWWKVHDYVILSEQAVGFRVSVTARSSGRRGVRSFFLPFGHSAPRL